MDIKDVKIGMIVLVVSIGSERMNNPEQAEVIQIDDPIVDLIPIRVRVPSGLEIHVSATEIEEVVTP